MKKACALFFCLSLAVVLHAQSVRGTWELVAVENQLPDGSKTQPYGVDPKGLLIFDDNGNYAIQMLRSTPVRPKFAAADKNKGTADENAALVQGSNSHFGKYIVNDKEHTIMFNIEHAFYPNWEGTTQVRSFNIKDDLLTYVVTNTTNGGAITAVVIWKRITSQAKRK
jgi:hypothetical protein